ncbi:hypothetical protein [Trinickia fusca]|uniref:Uncharacterized protein n=1 Tax=Trinickia fusca TaxID=2419777 RepID=A0A494XVS6_9BURK|nr:hypothetical protein [Trinickia fusca]RKP52169.1 hypothetical protein D7S89_01055 [Trinickia fusca]
MNDPRHSSNSASRVGALIVVAVLIVIATLVYNALKGKREYDRELAAEASSPAVAASGTGAASAALAASASQ